MPSSRSSSSSSFSLVARDLARERGAHTVLDRVNVSVGPRTRLGVVGPNGVGKTTLLRILAGQESPDRGSVTSTPPSLRVGYLALPDSTDAPAPAAIPVEFVAVDPAAPPVPATTPPTTVAPTTMPPSTDTVQALPPIAAAPTTAG